MFPSFDAFSLPSHPAPLPNFVGFFNSSLPDILTFWNLHDKIC